MAIIFLADGCRKGRHVFIYDIDIANFLCVSNHKTYINFLIAINKFVRSVGWFAMNLCKCYVHIKEMFTLRA